MGTLSVRESKETLMGAFGCPDTENTKLISVASTSAEATSLFKNTWYRIVSSTDCHVHFAASGDATTSHMFMKAGIPEIFYTGDFSRIAAIRNSADGVLYATPMQITVDQD